MNHLAHLFLAGRDRGSIVGNLAADFVKGRLDGSLPEGVARGIAMHRRVDAFTDAHPLVAASRRRLTPLLHHHARIVVDVFYDYFLFDQWETFTSEPLEEFVPRVYGELTAGLDLVPRPAAWPIARMIANGWLTRCRTVDGVSRTLTFIARRLRRPVDLAAATPLLERERDGFAREFRAFFPEVIALVRDERE
jgi:acyl carrier protein phosphodiesterase